MTTKLQIKIPSGEYCEGCRFDCNHDLYCYLFKAVKDSVLMGELKCDQCKNKEEIDVSYDENI